MASHGDGRFEHVCIVLATLSTHEHRETYQRYYGVWQLLVNEGRARLAGGEREGRQGA
jgi:hypothetical protein